MADRLLRLDIASRTDRGRKRSINEDAMLSIIPEDPQVLAKKGSLFVVSDGLGGHNKGEVASAFVVSQINDAYYQDEEGDITTSLRNAIEQANTALCKLIEAEGRTKDSMGTTCIAAVLHENTASIANVGDSRAYILRQGQIKQISEDHSWVAEQIRAGALTEEQARTHEKSNVITRCIGARTDLVEVDMFTETLQNDDTLILCTDGLWRSVSNDEICSIVEQPGTQDSAARLVERANEHGGPDNITVIVAHISLVPNTAVKQRVSF